jgi:hypothetical protein
MGLCKRDAGSTIATLGGLPFVAWRPIFAFTFAPRACSETLHPLRQGFALAHRLTAYTAAAKHYRPQV